MRGTDGRPDDRITELEQLARELWPEVAQPAVFLARLCALTEAPAGELAGYLRHSAQTVHADIPLAVACTEERWETYASRRRRRRKPPARAEAPPQDAGDALTPAELAELATGAIRDLR